MTNGVSLTADKRAALLRPATISEKSFEETWGKTSSVDSLLYSDLNRKSGRSSFKHFVTIAATQSTNFCCPGNSNDVFCE